MLDLWAAVLFDVGALLIVVMLGSSLLADKSFDSSDKVELSTKKGHGQHHDDHDHVDNSNDGGDESSKQHHHQHHHHTALPGGEEDDEEDDCGHDHGHVHSHGTHDASYRGIATSDITTVPGTSSKALIHNNSSSNNNSSSGNTNSNDLNSLEVRSSVSSHAL